MNVRKGCSYEVGGVWRKDSVEASTEEFPEASELDPLHRTAYVGFRLEQHLALLKWQNGAISDADYAALTAHLDQLCSRYVHAG